MTNPASAAAAWAELEPQLRAAGMGEIVAMHGEIVEDDDKIGALKREILGEAFVNMRVAAVSSPALRP